MKTKTRILLADDHPLLREALSQVFSSEKDMEIVGQANNGEEAVNLTSQLKPDVLVMDIMMPKFDGLEASKYLLRLEYAGYAPKTKNIDLKTDSYLGDIILARV